MSKLRISAWLLFFTALTAPTLWMQSELAKFADARLGPGCGLPVLGIIMAALLAAGLLSLIATLLGWLAWRCIPRPRPFYRMIEIFIMALPAVVCIILIITVFII